MWLIIIPAVGVLMYVHLSYQLYKMDDGIKKMTKEADRQIVALNERLEEVERKQHSK